MFLHAALVEHICKNPSLPLLHLTQNLDLASKSRPYVENFDPTSKSQPYVKPSKISLLFCALWRILAAAGEKEDLEIVRDSRDELVVVVTGIARTGLSSRRRWLGCAPNGVAVSVRSRG